MRFLASKVLLLKCKLTKIIKLYENESLYNNIIENAFELIKCGYTKELQVEKFEETLQEIFQK